MRKFFIAASMLVCSLLTIGAAPIVDYTSTGMTMILFFFGGVLVMVFLVRVDRRYKNKYLNRPNPTLPSEDPKRVFIARKREEDYDEATAMIDAKDMPKYRSSGFIIYRDEESEQT